MQKVRFAYNPKAGETVITDWLDNIIDIYQRGGYSIMPYRLAFTEAEETDLLDDIDGSYHHILVAGGDGTVNYVVNMLKRRNLDLPVAVLPTGTANDFANTLGVPSDIEKACRRILGGEIRRVDLGRANDEYFVNVFSCGLFTDVSQKTPTILKNTFGKLAYYFGGLGELPNFRKMHISIESDGGNYEGPSLIFFVFNGRTAGQMRFAYLSEIDDGLLDVIVIKGDRPIETVPDDLSFHQAQHEGLSGRNRPLQEPRHPAALLQRGNDRHRRAAGPGFRCASRANREPYA